MTDSYAILIDGGFLKKKISTYDQRADIRAVRLFMQRLRSHSELRSRKLYRVYYYDALPYSGSVTNPLSGVTENLKRTDVARDSKILLSQLSCEPFFTVRLGELVCRGWGLSKSGMQKIRSNLNDARIQSADLRPNLVQKEVDMRIGMDMAALALKRQVQAIVLVAADSDLIPAATFAREEGVQLFLARLEHKQMKKIFFEHVDLDIQVQQGAPEQINCTPTSA